MKKYIQQVVWQFSAMKYVLLAIVCVVPLFVSKAHAYPFSTPKALLLVMGGSVLAVLYIWGKAREKEPVLILGWGHLIVGLFVVVLLFSAFFGVNTNFSLFGDIGSGMSVILMANAAIVALSYSFLIQKNPSFLRVVTLTSFIASIVMVGILYGGESLLPMSAQGSTLGNTSYTGAYLLINICFAIGLFSSYHRAWQKILVALGGLFIVSSPILFNQDILKGTVSLSNVIKNPLLLSGSANGAVLGLGIAVIVIVFVYLIRSSKKIWQWVGSIALTLLFVGLFFAGQAIVNPNSRIHQAYVAEKSENRFLFWDIASHGMNQRMLFGWGINGYQYVFQEHFSPIFFAAGYVPEQWTNNPHNIFKEYAINTGIVGLIAYLLLVGGTAILLFKASRSEDRLQKAMCIAMFGALVGYTVQNMFVFDTTAPLLMFFLLVGSALGVSSFKTIAFKRTRTKRIIAGALIVGIGYIFIIAGIRPWQESKGWASFTNTNSIVKGKNPQQISLMGTSWDTGFLSDKVMTHFRKKIDLAAAKPKEREMYISIFKALSRELEVDIANDSRPNFRAIWSVGQVYNYLISASQITDPVLVAKARFHLEHAMSINPSNPLVYFDIAQTHIYEKDFAKVRSSIRAAIALAPQYRGTYQMADRIIASGMGTKEFESYVSTMKNRWCGEGTLCNKGTWK